MMSPDTFLSIFKAPFFFLHEIMFFAPLGHPAVVEDTLFSGPKKGEMVTPFQAVGEGNTSRKKWLAAGDDTDRLRSYPFPGE